MRVALGDQPRDPAGEHAGLARPGAGDHEQGRPLVDDGGALRLVETLEQLVLASGAGDGGAPRLPDSSAAGGLGREARDRELGSHLGATLRAGVDRAAPHTLS